MISSLKVTFMEKDAHGHMVHKMKYLMMELKIEFYIKVALYITCTYVSFYASCFYSHCLFNPIIRQKTIYFTWIFIVFYRKKS
eukprot:UN22816